MENFADKTNKLMSESILFIEDLCSDLKKRNYDVAAFLETKKNIENLKGNFDKREVCILFLGEVSTGKSSLINCILGENLLVVEERSCTNTITHIKYGEKEMIEVHFQPSEDGSEIPPKVINRSDLPMYTSERHNKDNHKNVAYVVISIPNEFLKGGINLFDAPGVGSMNPLHTFTTFSIARKADAVFYISTPIREFNECDVNNIKRISEHTQGCEFAHILTKKDQGNPKLILEKNKGHMQNLLGSKAVQYFMVSNTWYKNYLDNKDERRLKHSGFPELFAYLGNIAQNKDKILSQRYLTVLAELVYPILSDLKEVYDNIANPLNNQRLQQLQELKGRLNALQSEGHSWQRTLSSGMESIQSNLKQELVKDKSNFKADVHTMLEDKYNLTHPKSLSDKIGVKIGMLQDGYNNKINKELEKLSNRLLKDSDLESIHQELVSVKIEDKVCVGNANEIVRTNIVETAFVYAFRTSIATGLVASGLTGLGFGMAAALKATLVANLAISLAAILSNPVVAALLIAAAAVYGVKAGFQKAIEKIMNKINPQIDDVFRQLWDAIQQSLKRGKDGLDGAFSEMVRNEVTLCNSKIHNIQNGVQQDLNLLSSYGNRGKSLLELIKKETEDGKQ